jgi:hypothetical protein
MFARNHSSREFRLIRNPPISQTDMMRVRHTIDCLVRSESQLLKEIPSNSVEPESSQLHDLTQRIHELRWGWEELKRSLNSYNSDWFDQSKFLAECDSSLDRLQLLLEDLANKNMSQR